MEVQEFVCRIGDNSENDNLLYTDAVPDGDELKAIIE